jgi:hypothetical protein
MDGLEDLPFGPPPPPEQIPLVVPDIAPIPAAEARPQHRRCQQITKKGKVCNMYCLHDADVCLGHAKRDKNHGAAIKWAARERQMRAYKRPPPFQKPFTKEELLALLSSRMRKFIEIFGETPSVLTEGIICDLARTYAIVAKIDGVEQAAKLGWRMKGAV